MALFHIVTHISFVKLPVSLLWVRLNQVEIGAVEGCNMEGIFIKKFPITLKLAVLPISFICQSSRRVKQFPPPIHLIPSEPALVGASRWKDKPSSPMSNIFEFWMKSSLIDSIVNSLKIILIITVFWHWKTKWGLFIGWNHRYTASQKLASIPPH